MVKYSFFHLLGFSQPDLLVIAEFPDSPSSPTIGWSVVGGNSAISCCGSLGCWFGGQSNFGSSAEVSKTLRFENKPHYGII